MYSDEVARQVVAFLRTGHFQHASASPPEAGDAEVE
jgi:hypothetical protein